MEDLVVSQRLFEFKSKEQQPKAKTTFKFYIIIFHTYNFTSRFVCSVPTENYIHVQGDRKVFKWQL